MIVFPVQDQLQQKIVCPGMVTCLTASPDGVFLAAGVGEALHLWEVSCLNMDQMPGLPQTD